MDTLISVELNPENFLSLQGIILKSKSTMKKLSRFLIILSLLLPISGSSFSQKKVPGTDDITSSDLESYLDFIASPLLKGRMNGDPGLEIAQQFIVSQAKLMGLKPANGSSYLQQYSIIRNTMDPDKTMIQIIEDGKDTVTIRKPIFQLLPTGPSDFTVEGEVVFAGYALKQDKYGYNDLEGLNGEGKILVVMEGAPTTDDGKKFLFEGVNWASFMSIQVKLTALLFSRAAAVIFVTNPKSGFESLDEQFPGISGALTSNSNIKGEKSATLQLPNMPKIMFVHRSVADEILRGTGYNLADLQKQIDSELKPHTFAIPGKKIRISETAVSKEATLYNVAACVEGRDPVLKNEYVIFSGHADHLGESPKGINTGADDDGSGCAALLSMAKAFSGLNKKPLRSILFLWVSGEEIGLYGSKTYINNPLVPLKNTLADLNMDMIGRVKGVEDTTSETPMTGPDGIFVITGNQSKDLLSIAEKVDKGTVLNLDYSLSGRDHPLQLFSRSDHYNFVMKDIPVLFFTSGIHTDYHTPRDVVEKIDFKKMELVTRTMYQIGYEVANRKERIVIDNPFSKW